MMIKQNWSYAVGVMIGLWAAVLFSSASTNFGLRFSCVFIGATIMLNICTWLIGRQPTIFPNLYRRKK